MTENFHHLTLGCNFGCARYDMNVQGVPINNNPLGKILYLCNCSRFFHEI